MIHTRTLIPLSLYHTKMPFWLWIAPIFVTPVALIGWCLFFKIENDEILFDMESGTLKNEKSH